MFQTFMAGPIAFKALPRPSFSTLQTAIFPPFFAMQTALPIILALTWPGEKVASASSLAMREHSGWQGILHQNNFWTGLVPVGVMLLTGLANLVALGPMTTRVMRERKHQGKWYCCCSRPVTDASPQRREMARSTTTLARSRQRCSGSTPPLCGCMGPVRWPT